MPNNLTWLMMLNVKLWHQITQVPIYTPGWRKQALCMWSEGVKPTTSRFEVQICTYHYAMPHKVENLIINLTINLRYLLLCTSLGRVNKQKYLCMQNSVLWAKIKLSVIFMKRFLECFWNCNFLAKALFAKI